jgi:nicotinamide-nucleotide amidase
VSVRAGIVVTGTEVLSGRVQDRNGPWLADRLEELGVELAHVLITADRREDLLAALAFMRAEGADIIITSGGLGPTADDMTAEIVADFAERPLRLDEDLERRIGEIIARFARRWNLDPQALEVANRKQAMVPEGAVALDLVGTALARGAGRRADRGRPAGPPRELQESCAPRWRRSLTGGRGGAALPARDGADGRHPGIGDRRDAAGRGARSADRPRDHDACAAPSSRS